jgi:hypothetical protein
MSILNVPTYNGKVISNVSLMHPPPGGKKEYRASIHFNDGTWLTLKSESIITIEKTEG